MAAMSPSAPEVSASSSPFDELMRGAEFWRRATSIYGSYKLAQLRALVLRHTRGMSAEQLKHEVWLPQHEAAGQAMYQLCIDLRGFYLKAGQFIGSRADFIPEPICRQLTQLCDKVPPMSEGAALQALQRELGVGDLSAVFDWIELAKPLGSASISQVHKARLRTFPPRELAAARRALRRRLPAASPQACWMEVGPGQTAWDVSNAVAVGLDELARLNPGINLEAVQPGQRLAVPPWGGLAPPTPPGPLPSPSSPAHAASSTTNVGSSGPTDSSSSSALPPAAAAVLRATAAGTIPPGGLVAVKIQYPDALHTMTSDLKNIRAAALYLSKTELPFDLVSAVDELNKQIKLEFDFAREARVMDRIAQHLAPLSSRITVPRSVPGLVSKRLLVMQFIEGVPLLDLHSRVLQLSEAQRMVAKRRILSRVAEAYGHMILGEGLFQADGHPGNILVGKGARIGLLDYGQSKQLTPEQRLGLAQLILQLHKNASEAAVSKALADVGVATARDDVPLRAEMAFGMFDTRGKINPFDPNSPIKKCAITAFPPDLFFVLRVVQLLRGMASGMGISDFSSASQWAPLARTALASRGADSSSRSAGGRRWGWGCLTPWRR